MAQNISNAYEPDFAIHPGITLEDILRDSGMSQTDLAQRTGLTPKTINEIVQCKSSITPDTAIRLSAVFGMSAVFWNNLQRQYNEIEAKHKVEGKLTGELTALKRFTCYKELAMWKYVKQATNPKEKVKNLLNFFGVSSLELVEKVHPVAFRQSKIGTVSPEALAAWLRCGELEAKKVQAKKFDRKKLIESLNTLRGLTKESPKIFQEGLVDICASFGVVVTFVPYFKNTFVYGATRWLSTDKSLVQLSLKGRCSDLFWFTFFHELAHLLKHGKKEQFVEFENSNLYCGEEEKEADEFARDTLIPKKEYDEFYNEKDFSGVAIQRFAEKLNISPSIIAGRLGHDTRKWSRFNHLRQKYRFINND